MMKKNEYVQYLKDEMRALHNINESLAEQIDRNNHKIHIIRMELIRDYGEKV